MKMEREPWKSLVRQWFLDSNYKTPEQFYLHLVSLAALTPTLLCWAREALDIEAWAWGKDFS